MAQKIFSIVHLEDSIDVTDLMTLIFENDNIDYKPVHTVYDAFQCLDKGIPHLMLVDLCLENDIDPEPGMSFIKKAYRSYPGINMMVLSNRGDLWIRNELEKYIIDYELKIFRPSIFKEKLIEMLNKMENNNEQK